MILAIFARALGLGGGGSDVTSLGFSRGKEMIKFDSAMIAVEFIYSLKMKQRWFIHAKVI